MATLPYDPSSLKRELNLHYIGADAEDTGAMLRALGLGHHDDLFSHLPAEAHFSQAPDICPRLPYDALAQHLEELSQKNNILYCFLGDGLQHYSVHEIVPFVAGLRGLSTAYTPYQPERSQGTLHSLWPYACGLSALTGFKAIGSGLYDRSSALFEALNTALRIKKGPSKVLIHGGLHPRDLEVLVAHARHTAMELVTVPMDKQRGLLDGDKLEELLSRHQGLLAAFCFPQTNHFGQLEDVHALTDICHREHLVSVAVVDPLLHAPGGLTPPAQWGTEGTGTTMFVGEGQHLATGPNFGGPGLGVFGILFDSEHRHLIRHTPGRFVGRTRDRRGRPCFCLVLSTREQHIRRQRATSNICSNQSFLATLAGPPSWPEGPRAWVNLSPRPDPRPSGGIGSSLPMGGLNRPSPRGPFSTSSP